jgi:hypothetical protein
MGDSVQAAQALISLAVALWAAHTSITNGFKYLNDIRDSILCRSDGKRTFTPGHCGLMLINDWLPLTVGLSVVTGLFFLIIWFIPAFISPTQTGFTELLILCKLSSLVPLTVSIGNGFFAWRDYKMMRDSIADGSAVMSNGLANPEDS